MANEILIRVEQLYRYYGPHCAVNNVSFELAKGEVLGFLGPNGAGKSSTMQMITGNLAPSAGRITVAGTDLLDHPKQAKRQLGYLPEQPPLYRELTVDEYLNYCARLHGVSRGARAGALKRAKERCGLHVEGPRLIGNLSKGYQQRVGIAQAILHNPAVVILDEPTVGLDPIQIREIRALIRELGEDHGVILSTHILPEVQGTCSQVQIIHRGRLVFSDSTDSLEHRLRVHRLIVAFHNAPTVEELRQLTGVTDAEALAEGRFRVDFGDTDPAEAIVERAAAAGWRLYELTPERRTLEQIFVELTTAEHNHPEEAA
ncbi:MAG TPA: ATP-binding cassette domain-containing protein [Gammaproteobacteria bacterium]|nr:ATP-binding cassette domain-containing protein [Gammaproteobacteria bacterium]